MDDGEVETSDHDLFQNNNSSSNFQGSTSGDTHTCYHTHTQVLLTADDDGANNEEHSIPRPRRRPSRNREAVRKYREKKKAHTAYLEEEVKKLRLLNEQLVRKIQGQPILEVEFLRLRRLLLDLGGNIDDELGAFPLQKLCKTTAAIKEADCDPQSTVGAFGLPCQTHLPCYCPHVRTPLQASIDASGKKLVTLGGNCQPAVFDCKTTEVQNSDMVEILVSSATQAE